MITDAKTLIICQCSRMVKAYVIDAAILGAGIVDRSIHP